MESLGLEENIINDIRNHFRIKQELNYSGVKCIRNLLRLGKETKTVKDRILKGIKNIFQHEEEDYCKKVRVNNFWSNNYIEYESSLYRNKTLLVEEYLNKIRQNLKDIINNLKKSDTWKVQLIIENNFIFSIDNDEERKMHSKSDNTEIMINHEADDVIKKLLDSLKNTYQYNLKSMRNSESFFNYFQLLYFHKCHKINLNWGGSYVDSPDWTKNKKGTINLINKKNSKFCNNEIKSWRNKKKPAKNLKK